MDLDDPTEAALVCAAAFDRAGLSWAVCGGLAIAAYGEPRETRDVDVAVSDVSAAAARSALEAAGIACAESCDGVRFGGLFLGGVALLGGNDAVGTNVVDLVRPASERYATAVLARAAVGDLRGRAIRVVSAEDLILLKVLASRDRDLEDAASVLRRTGALLDRSLVESEVALLAAELSDVDVRGRWARVLASAAA